MTDVQLIFDALPPPIKAENYDALCQGINPKNEIRDVKSLNHGSCRTIQIYILELNRPVWKEKIQGVEKKWCDLPLKFHTCGRCFEGQVFVSCFVLLFFRILGGFFHPTVSARQWHFGSFLISSDRIPNFPETPFLSGKDSEHSS